MKPQRLSSAKLTELEKTRMVLNTKKKQLSRLMVEIALLREKEKTLTPLSQALEKLEGTGSEALEPSEPLFQVSRTYQPS